MKRSIIGGAVLALMALGIYFIVAQAANKEAYCLNTPAEEMDIGGHQNLALHIHQMLTITINGEKYSVPAGIGLVGDIMRPTHTHDSTGKLHVEGPCPRDFTLGEFFDVWNQEFNSTCIFSYCEDETHSLTLYVNGVENTEYRDLVLKDHDGIEIVFAEVSDA